MAGGLQPLYIAGGLSGLVTDRKPFLLPDQAFVTLQNAYCWRERVKKREGLQLLGRLRRVQTAISGGVYTTINGTNTYNIFIGAGFLEPNAELQPGSVTTPLTIVFGAPINQTLTDTAGNGTLTITGAGPITSAYINYVTGNVTITANAISGPAAVTLTFAYFPNLPVTGALSREISTVNNEQTVFFDTIYAYIFSGGQFQEWIPGTIWNADSWNLMYGTNYRGITPDVRLFFVTNFINDALNPIRYTDGTTWTTFQPYLSQATPPNPAVDTKLYQARIIIPYFGRLLALNVWEGTETGGYAGAVNIFNRCRFSQIGDPIDQTNSWRTDIFGRGGFIDAPTNEAIISAIFFKNTLIVRFERSTWQLRYVGEYGLPFLWERISSDFGSDSTFSEILFDPGVLAIGDKAITSSTAISVDRIDLAIPDTVFGMRNSEHGIERVYGVRDFQKEVVYWTYADSNLFGEGQVFPNQILLFNYRNNTWAKFDDRVTCFGTYQPPEGITWDRDDIFWGDYNVFWRDDVNQSQFPDIVAGNSQGWVHYFGYDNPDDPSYSIQGINLGVTPIELTIPNHTLSTGDIIQITGLQFVDTNTGVPEATDLNDQFYQVRFLDASTVSILKWDGDNYATFTFTPSGAVTYVGGGTITFYPKLLVMTKDFNPYQNTGQQTKMAYVDFLMDATFAAAMSVQIYCNSSLSIQGNLLVGNTQSESYLPSPYYGPGSDYAWHRFYATTFGQFFRLVLAYDDSLMNVIATHQQDWILNAVALHVRPGGKQIF